MKKIYIASPFFNPAEVAFVEKIEKLIDDLPDYYYYSPRQDGVLLDMSDEDKDKRKTNIFNANVNNIDSAELVVAVTDNRDVGTVWEMGLAYGMGKRTITISNQSYGLNVMLAESVQAHVTDLDDLVRAITEPSFTGDLIRGVF